MLVSPAAWYFAVPGVTTTGPFNQHFLRDIGLIFVLIGLAFLVGIARPAMRVMLWGAAALWLAGHALFHFWEVAVGICGPSALARDFPAVTLPAIIAAAADDLGRAPCHTHTACFVSSLSANCPRIGEPT